MAFSFFKGKKNRNTAPSDILDPGWQFYSKPTQLEKPGTIFRINDQQIKYQVGELDVQTQTGEEAAGKTTETITVDIGIAARIFGMVNFGISASIKHTSSFDLIFELSNPKREITTDLAIADALKAFWDKLEYRADSEYYLIREARTCTGIIYELTDSQMNELGGEATFQNSISLKGNLFKLDKSKGYNLKGEFPAPLRVMFLAEQIKPRTRNLGAGQIQFGKVPVTHQLNWIDEAD
ncbi:MAG: hypothetical protein JWQ38_1752 [Flavipsychrobacter sp.]|nr:hypothetical protein [Flavipsychrobacter sp.]